MANSTQLENQEVERLQGLEISNAPIPASDLKTELLHHLVDVSRLFQQKKSGDRETEELIKKNAGLVSQLLNSSIEQPTVKPADWNEILLQKLADSKADLADEKVGEFVHKRIEMATKEIESVVNALVSCGNSLGRFEDTAVFEFDPKKNLCTSNYNITGMYDTANMRTEKLYLRGLIFKIQLCSYLNSQSLYVDCHDLPEKMCCKTKVNVTIKNQDDQRDSVRSFSKVFGKQAKKTVNNTGYYGDQTQQKQKMQLAMNHLIRREEYEDESLGMMKDGKIRVEVTIQTEELTEIEEETAKPAEEEPATNKKAVTDEKATGEEKAAGEEKPAATKQSS